MGGVLAARVRRVDPAAYTKVSALGIEEQRVDVVLDIVDPPEVWHNLGHAFRVMAHLVVWQADSVVRVPLGALFRRGSDWAVFKVVDGRAVETRVVIGHRTDTVAEVTGGLAAGDAVVLHPSDQVIDGVAVSSPGRRTCRRFHLHFIDEATIYATTNNAGRVARAV